MKTLLCFLLCCCVASAYKSYKGYQVYRITVDTQEQLDFLRKVTEDPDLYNVWKEGSLYTEHMDIMVAPLAQKPFIQLLKRNRMAYRTMLEDVDVAIQRQLPKPSRNPSARHDYTQYHDWAGINAWIDEMAARYSSHVSVFDVGTSYENRTIRGIKISSGGTGKPAIYVDSCIHAREWIAAATTTYFTDKLLQEYLTDPVIQGYLDRIDIYMVPVVNADGYVFTWTDDRMWRKTRSPNEGSACIGTDPNRNWDFFHCEHGSSRLPCSDAYCGSAPWSEKEVNSTRQFLQTIPNLQMFFAYHAYGQWYMAPYAHYIDPPTDHDNTMAVCQSAMNQLRAVDGTVFECGTIESFVGQTSGSSVDWAKVNLGVKYNFGPELRDEGQFGFLLPEGQIIPSGEENYAAIVSFLGQIDSENP